VKYNQSFWQWWGERPEGCKKTIELAHEGGLKVMLKPQIYVPGSWTGAIDFKTEADWKAWENSYEQFMLEMAEIANHYQVGLFCIGTEYKISSRARPDFWRNLIKKIRSKYNCQLVYAANWDEFKDISFWDDLDYIGVSAYFPLSEQKTPTIEALQEKWLPHKNLIAEVADRFKRPILFTEYGYLSVDGCANKTWEIEGKIRSVSKNEQAQANALHALFATFWDQPYWAGGFLWKWFPNMRGHEGYPAKDYTPQGKIAEQTLEQWYKQNK